MSNLLEGLKRHTTIVADTGDFRAIECLRPGLNEGAMAVEKLAEGIRAFAADTQKLEALVATAH